MLIINTLIIYTEAILTTVRASNAILNLGQGEFPSTVGRKVKRSTYDRIIFRTSVFYITIYIKNIYGILVIC